MNKYSEHGYVPSEVLECYMMTRSSLVLFIFVLFYFRPINSFVKLVILDRPCIHLCRLALFYCVYNSPPSIIKRNDIHCCVSHTSIFKSSLRQVTFFTSQGAVQVCVSQHISLYHATKSIDSRDLSITSHPSLHLFGRASTHSWLLIQLGTPRPI